MPIIQDPKKKYINNYSPSMFANSPTLSSANKPIGSKEYQAKNVSMGLEPNAVRPSNPSATNTVKSNIATTSAPKTQLPPAAQPFINSLANTPQTATTASTATTAQGTASTATPSAYDTARKAYLDSYKAYLDSLKTPTGTSVAEQNVQSFNERAAQEMLRNRQREEELRKNEIGQLERGQQYQLGEEERLSNRSLADLALAKGVSLESIKLAQEQRKSQQEAAKAGLGFAQSEVEFAQGEKPVEVGGNLVNPRTGEVVYQSPEKPAAKPASVQEYEYYESLSPQEKKQWNAYQTADANRKQTALTALQDGQLTSKQTSTALQLANSLKSHPMYTDMLDIATGLSGVKTGLSQKNGFGDITAINAFQRMVDPGATVRSEDVVLLQSASAFLQKVLSDYPIKKLTQGDKLPDAVRATMQKTAQDLYDVRSGNYNESVGNQYKSLAEASSIPFEFVGSDFPTQGNPEIAELRAQGYSDDQIQEIINAQ